MITYDFIILGSGAAGLSLLMRMIHSRRFNKNKILLIDRDAKNTNDRTWCFWEKENGFFENLVYRRWNNVSFYSDSFSSVLDIQPYQYKMIRGLDFYNYCFDTIKRESNIDVKHGEVKSFFNDKNGVTIHLDEQVLHYGPAIVFNSLYKPADSLKGTLQLLQHFKGWFIETQNAFFKAMCNAYGFQDSSTIWYFILLCTSPV